MDRRRLKFVILGSGIAATMIFLIVLGVNRPGGFVYYLTVGEFLSEPQRHGSFRVNGKVAPGTIDRRATGSEVRFVMTDGTVSLPVEYRGIVPDTFVDEADVVVEGTLRADGVFDATLLLAKCPSKYEAEAERRDEA